MKNKDLTGQKIGRLKVLERISRYNGGNKTYYRCICDCGKECIKYGYYLSTGRTNSCGCLRVDGRKKGRKPYAFQVGDIIETNSGRIQIISQEGRVRKQYDGYGHTNKMYVYKCLLCGYSDSTSESSLKRKNGCPVCGGQKCVRGKSDLWSTDPHIAELLWNPEEGYQHRRREAYYTDWKCPVCGKKIKHKNIAQITVEGHVSCPTCSDSISYPNKFMFYLLNELGEIFQTEYSPDWAGLFRYDFAIENKMLIVEMDGGLGHGGKQWGKNNHISPEESLKKDEYKDQLAIKNGYDIVRINCKYDRNNRFEFIRNNVCNSKLGHMYDLSKIDFKAIDALCWKSNVAIACEYYNSTSLSVTEIADKMHLYYETVRGYLKKGSTIGLCDYSPDNVRLPESYYDSKERQKRPVLIYSKDGTFIGFFSSIHDAAKTTGVNSSYIINVCKGLKDSGKGYVFRFYKTKKGEEFIPEEPELYLMPVNQYTKNGKYLKTYATILEAQQRNPAIKSIQKASRVNHAVYSGGFQWKTDDGDHSDIGSYIGHNSRAVAQIDLETGNVINIFNSVSEAAALTGLQKANIEYVCLGKRNKCGGFFWKYADDTNGYNQYQAKHLT